MSTYSLDDAKQLILKTFRRNVSDLLQPRHDDRFLLRWLRARDYDIEKAEKMLREDFKFRKKLGSDRLVQEDYNMRKELQPYACNAFLGFDREGHLVRFFRGGCDLKGFTRSMTLMESVKYFAKLFEWDHQKLKENNMKTGKYAEKSTYLLDYSGFIFSQQFDRIVLRYAIQLAKLYQDHYPESMHVTYIVNTPYLFYQLFNMIKPFLNEVVLKKMKIYSVGDDSWRKEFFALVPKEIVPAFLGGTRYEPDSKCSSMVSWDVWVPRNLYLSDYSTLKTSDPDVKQKLIRERSFFEVEKNVEKSDVILCWEFQTKEHNINFGLFYKPKKNRNRQGRPGQNSAKDREVLLPVETVDCSDIVESGEYLCRKPGTYILHFDNTFSWIRSKYLLYKIEVHSATDIPADDLGA